MSMSSEEGSSTGNNLAHAAKLQEKFKIVSSQSSGKNLDFNFFFVKSNF